MAPNETNAPTPRGPEDEKTGDDRRGESGTSQSEQGKPAQPSPLDHPASPDANPIDPRVGQK